MAWAAANKLRSIINSKANDAIKIGLCQSAVESILLYVHECLPLTSTLQDKLESVYRRNLRYSFGFTSLSACPTLSWGKVSVRQTSKSSSSKKTRTWRTWSKMANPLPLSILLRFLQPGLRRSLDKHEHRLCSITLLTSFLQSINLWNL